MKLLFYIFITTCFLFLGGVSCKNEYSLNYSLNPVPEAALRLINPKGGECFFIGDTVFIKWKAQTELISSVEVWITVGANAKKNSLATHSFSPKDSCRWIIGGECGLLAGDSVRIIIEDYNDHLKSDRTNDFIKIRERLATIDHS